MQRVSAIVLTAFLLLSGGCGRVGGEPFQPSLNTPVTLGEETSVAQIVNPNGESVSSVDLSVATFDQRPDPQGVLTVTLDGANATASAEVSGADMTDGAWVAATFDPPVLVDDLATIGVSWQGDTPLALWSNRALPGTEGITNDPYGPGQLVLDGEPTSGDLAFRVTTAAGPADGIAQLIEVVRGAAARLLDQPVFTLLWTIMLVGSAVLARRGRPASD